MDSGTSGHHGHGQGSYVRGATVDEGEGEGEEGGKASAAGAGNGGASFQTFLPHRANGEFTYIPTFWGEIIIAPVLAFVKLRESKIIRKPPRVASEMATATSTRYATTVNLVRSLRSKIEIPFWKWVGIS